MIQSINPATGEALATYNELPPQELESKLALAARAYQTYRRMSIAERGARLQKAAQILESEKDHFARIITLEMGKPIEAARQESAKCALACRYYVEHGERFLAPERVTDDAEVHYQPIGPVLAVMPWNFPFWQVFRFAAPALIAGNVGLLKHASNVPQCALAIEGILRRAGFPEGAFQTLLIGSKTVEQVIRDRRIAAVTLTGSEPAGRQVGAQAGSEIKKSVLELGGSDPFIVMPSADFDAAVRTAITARCINNGQSCIAAKRFIVHTDIYDAFESAFVAVMRNLTVGDPMDPATQVGPLATRAIRDELHQQVTRSGARALTGGAPIDGPGNFYAPTVLADMPRDFREELFGPVAVLYRARDLDDAIAIANDTPFGLGASVWTRDESEKLRFISDIESGMVFVNAMVASDPRLPFGGVKTSGYGRELSVIGLREFLNLKTVVTK
ncbi:MAG TPA: NAD-dependent succinate-semialdehyde dehydrogenase [Candidatus Solibacter sp.]|nr:NAD-dependent succinate-semialdehyde dehydrogenase [Candidatus Solibacter sp.]